MKYVVDASVVMKWFVEEELVAEAHRLLDEPDALYAPDLVVIEITNGAWKKYLRGEIAREQAKSIAALIHKGPLRLVSGSSLHQRALAIAMTIRHPVYDCLYIACAEVGEGILVTADKRLCAVVRDTAFGHLVQHLSDLAL